jgi:hypothetical protein
MLDDGGEVVSCLLDGKGSKGRKGTSARVVPLPFLWGMFVWLQRPRWLLSRQAIFGAIIPPGGGHEDRGRGGHGGASPGAPLSARGWPLCLGNKKAPAAGGAPPDLGQRERLRRLVLDHESARVMRARVVTMPGVYVCILVRDVCKSKQKIPTLRVAAKCVRWLGWGIDCALTRRELRGSGRELGNGGRPQISLIARMGDVTDENGKVAGGAVVGHASSPLACRDAVRPPNSAMPALSSYYERWCLSQYSNSGAKYSTEMKSRPKRSSSRS